MQRRVLLGVTAEQVGVGSEQKLDYLQASIQCRQVQRRLELVIPHGGVRQLLQQQPHHLRVAVLSGTVQRRLVVIVLLGADKHVRKRQHRQRQRRDEEEQKRRDMTRIMSC